VIEILSALHSSPIARLKVPLLFDVCMLCCVIVIVIVMVIVIVVVILIVIVSAIVIVIVNVFLNALDSIKPKQVRAMWERNLMFARGNCNCSRNCFVLTPGDLESCSERVDGVSGRAGLADEHRGQFPPLSHVAGEEQAARCALPGPAAHRSHLS
jgi:hypothetical protein